jgi:site-specific DNA recombinase
VATKLQNYPSKLKVYGYIRVSTEEQVSQGLSLNVQTDKIQTYAQSKNFELVEILKDKGLSGKNLQRPGLQELIRMAKKEKECAIIVYKLDRLTRNTGDLLNLIDNFFRAEKITLFSVSEEVDVNSPMGRFTLTVMGAMAQMEREVLSERVSSSLQYKKQQGHSLGLVPYGFERIDGMLRKQSEEQNILRRMKRWRKEGLGYKRIADRLNEKGIKPRRKKAKWHASSVHHILKRTS